MFNDLFDELNKMFNEVNGEAKEAVKNVKSYITVNAKENEDAYLVEAAIPGVNKEDIAINYNDGTLTIEAKEHESEVKEEKKDAKFLLKERAAGFYKRQINLNKVESEGIRAKYENGILSIVLPKIKQQTRTINID